MISNDARTLGAGVKHLAGAVGPLQCAQGPAIGVYCLYLLPYIVISYYDRYAFLVLAAQNAPGDLGNRTCVVASCSDSARSRIRHDSGVRLIMT